MTGDEGLVASHQPSGTLSVLNGCKRVTAMLQRSLKIFDDDNNGGVKLKTATRPVVLFVKEPGTKAVRGQLMEGGWIKEGITRYTTNDEPHRQLFQVLDRIIEFDENGNFKNSSVQPSKLQPLVANWKLTLHDLPLAGLDQASQKAQPDKGLDEISLGLVFGKSAYDASVYLYDKMTQYDVTTSRHNVVRNDEPKDPNNPEDDENSLAYWKWLMSWDDNKSVVDNLQNYILLDTYFVSFSKICVTVFASCIGLIISFQIMQETWYNCRKLIKNIGDSREEIREKNEMSRFLLGKEGSSDEESSYDSEDAPSGDYSDREDYSDSKDYSDSDTDSDEITGSDDGSDSCFDSENSPSAED